MSRGRRFEVEALCKEICGEPLTGVRVTVGESDFVEYLYLLEKSDHVLEYQVFRAKAPKERVLLKEYDRTGSRSLSKWKDTCWFERTGNKRK